VPNWTVQIEESNTNWSSSSWLLSRLPSHPWRTKGSQRKN